MEKVNSKWAVVIGASRGIGRALALSLAKDGYSVFAVARTESQLQRLGEEVRLLGVEFFAMVLDLKKNSAAQALCERLTQNQFHKKMRVLRINAGVNPMGRFSEIPLSEHQAMIAVNVEFPLNFLHSILPQLKDESVHIVTLSSQSAYMPIPWMAAYAASKSFVHQLSLALSYEWKNSGIRFITAIPAATETSIHESSGLAKEFF